MDKTLAEYLYTIYALPEAIDPKSDALALKTIEEFRKYNSLVEDSTTKKRSIPDEFRNFEQYLMGHNFHPHKAPEDKKRLSELEAVVGRLDLEDGSSLFFNPVSLSAGFGVLATALIGGVQATEIQKAYRNEISRRSFLKNAGTIIGCGIGIGGLAGALLSSSRWETQEKALKDGLYVQAIIDKLYK